VAARHYDLQGALDTIEAELTGLIKPGDTITVDDQPCQTVAASQSWDLLSLGVLLAPAGGIDRRGKSIVNIQPLPGISCTWMSPEFARAAFSAIDSPSPSPDRSELP